MLNIYKKKTVYFLFILFYTILFTLTSYLNIMLNIKYIVYNISMYHTYILGIIIFVFIYTFFSLIFKFKIFYEYYIIIR